MIFGKKKIHLFLSILRALEKQPKWKQHLVFQAEVLADCWRRKHISAEVNIARQSCNLLALACLLVAVQSVAKPCWCHMCPDVSTMALFMSVQQIKTLTLPPASLSWNIPGKRVVLAQGWGRARCQQHQQQAVPGQELALPPVLA